MVLAILFIPGQSSLLRHDYLIMIVEWPKHLALSCLWSVQLQFHWSSSDTNVDHGIGIKNKSCRPRLDIYLQTSLNKNVRMISDLADFNSKASEERQKALSYTSCVY